MEPVSLKTSYAKTLIVISSNDTQYLRWYNQPLAFAEVKDKTWSGDRTSETWEAMAGIPTTETFYINAGGTPVFCDIKAKYTETSFSKNYNETYTHTWMVGDELVRCTCTDVQPRTFNISYITIESVTLRTSEKAILNNAKIFVDEKQEVPISSPVTYKADGSNEYYIDARGTSINSNAYGVDDEKEAWSESGGGSEHRAAKLLKGHMEEITVFRNSDKVKIWIEGEEYEILVGKRDKDNVYNNSATLIVSISDQWKPTSPDGTYIWDKNTKIPFVGYIGQPQAGDGRNIGSPDVPEKLRFYKTEVKIPLNEVNGYYDFVDRFDEQYMEYSEAFALIKDNLNTEPDEQPVLEYIDYKSTPSATHTLDQVDGISVNSVIIHNPVSAQDIWIHQTPNQDLEDQRVNRNNYKQPKTYIDFTFGITIPNTGSFEINELKNNQTDLNANSLLKVEQAPGVLGKSFVGKYKLAFNIAERNKNYPSSIPDANNLDTSLWIRAKYIRLPFNAYYNSKLYQKNTWITLYDQGRDEAKTGDPTQFPIYITSDNPDMASARIFYVNEAINAPEDLAGKPDKLYADAEKNANTLRDSGGKYNDLEGDNVAKLSARHSARYSTTQDVIGRIGNIIVDDSSEPRYTNVFWKPDKTKPLLDFLFWPLIEPGGNFYSLYYNMFEEKTIKSSTFDNRWGTLSDYHDAAAYRQGDIPVTKTNNPSGSYGDGVIRITPHYLFINPYKGIASENIMLYKANGMVYNQYYDFASSINADTASSYTPFERIILMHSLKNARAKINTHEKGTASYINSTNTNQTFLGTPSYIEIPTQLRTYIGSTQTTGNIGGYNSHAGNIANPDGSWKNAQRWHASMYLPSSTMVLEKGAKDFFKTWGTYLVTYMKMETANSSSPWELEIKTNNANDGEGNPTKPGTYIDTGDNPHGPGVKITYPTPTPSNTPKPQLPIIVFDVGLSSASDTRVVGTH